MNEIQKADTPQVEQQHETQPPENYDGIRNLLMQKELDALTGGMLELTEEELKILQEPVNEEDIEILPNGELYLPWQFYASRLNRAFTPTGWKLLEASPPLRRVKQNCIVIIQKFTLVIKNHIIDTAFGEANFYPNNPTATETRALEAAIASALRRIAGKRLGIGVELWNKTFVEKWRAKYAIQDVDEKGKKYWRKRLPEDKGREDRNKLLAQLRKVMTEKKIDASKVREICQQKFGVETSAELTIEQLQDLVKSIKEEK